MNIGILPCQWNLTMFVLRVWKQVKRCVCQVYLLEAFVVLCEWSKSWCCEYRATFILVFISHVLLMSSVNKLNRAHARCLYLQWSMKNDHNSTLSPSECSVFDSWPLLCIVNPNPRARKAYLTRNRVSNNVMAPPGFDPRTSRTPAPWPGRPSHCVSLPGPAFSCTFRCSRDDAITPDGFSQ